MIPRRGVTLIEAVISTGLIAGACAAVVTAAAQAGMARAKLEERAIAESIAAEVLEVILAYPFDDPDGPGTIGPDAGESTRADFDDADDFHDMKVMLSSSGARTSVRSPLQWKVWATVTNYDVDSAKDLDERTGYKRIEVRVLRNDKPVAVAQSVRAAAWDAVTAGVTP